MDHSADKHTNLPNNFAGGRIAPEVLDSMSSVELSDALERALDAMTEDSYDGALVDAYLDALDRKAPLAERPDINAAFDDFQMRRRQIAPQDTPAGKNILYRGLKQFRLQKLFRVGLAAALAVICLLGTMAVAQAAGIDVFAAIAKWSTNIFSFGQISSDGAVDINLPDTAGGKTEVSAPSETVGNSNDEYASLQEILDVYHVTEVQAPMWIPPGFVLNKITASCESDPESYDFYAEYVKGSDILQISFMSYFDIPAAEIEKTDLAVEEFELNGVMFYQIENINNHMIAWVTEHFECYISGTIDVDVLKQVALSTSGE